MILLLIYSYERCDSATLAGSLTSYNDNIDRIISQNSNTDDIARSDQVIKTVVNINDTNISAVLNNFNISIDDILRRISAPVPITTEPLNISLNSENSETNEDTQVGQK